jgi:hypothetical protein
MEDSMRNEAALLMNRSRDSPNGGSIPHRSKRRVVKTRKQTHKLQTLADSGDGPLAVAPPKPVDWNSPNVFHDGRDEMIRVAAYYLAEKRGFAPGAELDDWLQAEAAIDARLNE